ncbi:MAG: AAA family ATPase [Bacteroidales bacterium]|nr:AAA family ATPase [Bacteroidales bacterium]
MNTVKNIFKPYESDGRSSMILTGRSIYDFECREDGSICTLVQLMAEYAKRMHMVMVRYSLASGIVVPYNMYEKADSETIKKILSANGISNTKCATGNCNASQELVDILRGISRLASAPTANNWQDGETMKFLFVFEFTSDIMPNATTANQLVARELIYNLVCSRPFLDNGNMFILSDVTEGKIDSQVQGLIYHLFLPYPNYEEKLEFVKGLHRQYPNAQYSPELDDQQIANLSSSTPNRGLDLVFRASHISGGPIEVKGLIEQKSKDVQAISEETISMLDTTRIKEVALKGENVRVPMEFLRKQANGLRSRDKSIPTNILLLGAPGTGKTDMAILTAHWAAVPIYQLNSPKAGIVGETERRATLQTRIFASTTPNIGFIDEVSEAIPSQRTNNLDSGASDSVMQATLSMLSDNTREGNSLLIATSNCGNKMCAAMLDRFVIVPVIMPSIEDLPEIICSISKQVAKVTLNPQDSFIQQAAKVLYDKHLMPRRIRAALKLACQQDGLTSKAILDAAKDANPLDEASWLAAVYADLDAISHTVSKRLLPWYGREDNYPFPDYIKQILDENMEVDPVKLNQELNRLKPYVNV